MFGYRIPQPDEALLISGRRSRDGGETPFRIVTGHGVFVVPVLRRASTLTLAMQEAEVDEDCYTTQGLAVHVRAVIAFKVGDDTDSITKAARRFRRDQRQMPALVGRIFSGHLRSIVGSMTVESIIRDQQALAENIVGASKPELARIGLVVDSLQISQIDDKDIGYIAALAKPHQAEVDKAAAVAAARAAQQAAAAEQESARNQSEYARQTAIVRAQYQAEVDAEQRKAAAAGPLADARAQQAVIEAQQEVARRNAELRREQLTAEVVRPAEAEAARVRIAAEAEADAIRRRAEAAASSDRIALEQRLIELLPEMVRAAGAGLGGANVTVLNGATGLNEVVAQLAGQGSAVLRAVLENLGSDERSGPEPAREEDARPRAQLEP
ncbi:flotillin family protein [Kineococcus rhizosphaerae]|uniref:SPFH domain/Band 7 family protein n=1 Tax=Kineococcus rhizosphaerae TaxID=559628 RepID=A0A2T0R7E5_9ACTN|nr:flotillin family protein [Kineococcus rhizosphaerae]PRY17061.1 SPFH domain/Band 7 family protein [Kineococcus rhizosphaerae]